MKVGSLFSGGGLGDFGFMAAGMDIAWQCEIDEYCQKILALRYPESKKYRDIKTLKGAELEPVDIITGGFPCQPFSNAGSKMGKSDDRHLWPEMFRVIQEAKPSWVVGENVSGFVDMALDDVCANLESAGYETTTLIFPAHAIGAWHRRERVWIVGYSEHVGRYAAKERGSVTQRSYGIQTGTDKTCEPSRSSEQYENVANTELCGCVHGQAQEQSAEGRIDAQREPEPSGADVPDTNELHGKRSRQDGDSKGWQGQDKRQAGLCGADRWRTYWEVEPAVGRVANGIASRVHRLKMLGNGQVPACTYVIGKMIMDLTANVVKESE